MGNCNFKDKNKSGDSSDEKISKNLFNYLYVIGKGGFGRVWRVEKKNTKEIFAMKEMSKVKVFEKNSVASVVNERKLLAHLRHPFIINMHYAFQDRENLYILMDHLGGGDLRYHISRQKKFNENQAKFFICCLLLALEYLHHNNIMHRDIKPENLVFDEKGYLYLTDMGIAKLYRPNIKIVDSSGTPGYMAPEVINNGDHNLTCDYFAIGVMVHEFMFCKRPYLGKNRNQIIEQMRVVDINIKISDVPEGWSIEAADFINKLLRRKNKERLGRNGIYELKDHAWLKNIPWSELYKKELISPYIPKIGDNFDANYCNKVDPIEKQTYDFLLHKVNSDNSFNQFYFNYFDPKGREQFFELDGVQYKFSNNFEDRNSNNEKMESTHGKNKYVGSTLSATPRLMDSTMNTGLSGLNSNNNSYVTKKIIVP